MRWAAWMIPAVAIGHAWASCAAKKPVKALSDAELERLEQSWQAGDEDQELETEDQALAREIRTREDKGELGATVMFVELKGSPDQAETDLFGERMLNLAITGGVQPRVFKLKPGQLVFALNKGWLANSLFDLLNDQEMVKNVEWKDGAHQTTKPKHDEL